MRNALFVSGLVALAGAIAIAVALLGGGDDSERERAAGRTATTETEPAQTVERAVPVAPQARVVAGQFILWAVSTKATRSDLARAWNILHPDYKAECQCTRSEWLTGNIPVQPYPVDDVEQATFEIDESFADRVVLEVALLPKAGARVESQIFFIGLKRGGADGKGRWLVNYWAPRQGPEQGVNVAPGGG